MKNEKNHFLSSADFEELECEEITLFKGLTLTESSDFNIDEFFSLATVSDYTLSS